MTEEYILSEVRREKRIEVHLEMLIDISNFKTGKIVTSFESLALILSGHEPIKDYNFDIDQFKSWCRENRLRVHVDEIKRTVHLECK
jgi:hypothetical protein